MADSWLTEDWCVADACPAATCNGPHVGHQCSDGYEVVARADDETPCPYCGHRPQL